MSTLSRSQTRPRPPERSKTPRSPPTPPTRRGTQPGPGGGRGSCTTTTSFDRCRRNIRGSLGWSRTRLVVSWLPPSDLWKALLPLRSLRALCPSTGGVCRGGRPYALCRHSDPVPVHGGWGVAVGAEDPTPSPVTPTLCPSTGGPQWRPWGKVPVGRVEEIPVVYGTLGSTNVLPEVKPVPETREEIRDRCPTRETFWVRLSQSRVSPRSVPSDVPVEVDPFGKLRSEASRHEGPPRHPTAGKRKPVPKERTPTGVAMSVVGSSSKTSSFPAPQPGTRGRVVVVN